ncbi:hypothetical protein [Rhodovulum kholense]|uniref:Uncharacterized protein n=1 Tax=Rhodovulum kholense TaxID=453584 RepID=A0A8E2VI97_9RHOB|nr:hypothetical protein [Rhodovulum kholense]PTW47183.1 hypothetical protein C8N38_110152 [Rhodovulum kholense]
MTGPTLLLAYASWAVGPVVAYAALGHGLKRSAIGFTVLFGLYTTAVWLIWGGLQLQKADGGGGLAPIAVLAPWGGVAVLSALLYALGAWIGDGE